MAAHPQPRVPVRILVRHADAGTRLGWYGRDDRRPLSPLGAVQAENLVDRLVHLPPLRVLSSPALRCRQTVVPLARRYGLAVEPCRLLAADADPELLAAYLGDPETERAVLCTHREILLGVFSCLAIAGPRLIDGIFPMQAAAGWAVYGGTVPHRIRYLPAAEPVRDRSDVVRHRG